MTADPRTEATVGLRSREVLVAVVIEAMIVGALGMAFVGILRGTSQRQSEPLASGDARIAAAYVIRDATQLERS